MLVLNTATKHVSPQYHVLIDQKFTSIENPKLLPTEWQNLVENNSWTLNFDVSDKTETLDISMTFDHIKSCTEDEVLLPNLPSTHPFNSIKRNMIQHGLKSHNRQSPRDLQHSATTEGVTHNAQQSEGAGQHQAAHTPEGANESGRFKHPEGAEQSQNLNNSE